MNETAAKEVNCSTAGGGSRAGNFSKLALVLLSLTLHQAEANEYAGSLLDQKFWDEVNFPSRSYYSPRNYYPEQPWLRYNDRFYDGGRHTGYNTGLGYGGWYGSGTGGERGWSQDRQDAKRQGQISTGFSNSYSKNEKGDSSVYYHDGLVRSADLAYDGIGSRYRDDNGGYEHGRYSRRGGDVRGHSDRPYPWYHSPSSNYYPRYSRFYVPTKKTSLYVVPPPKKYYIDKP